MCQNSLMLLQITTVLCTVNIEINHLMQWDAVRKLEDYEL